MNREFEAIPGYHRTQVRTTFKLSGSIWDPTVTYTYVIDIVALALFTIVLVAASTQILEKRIA